MQTCCTSHHLSLLHVHIFDVTGTPTPIKMSNALINIYQHLSTDAVTYGSYSQSPYGGFQ